MDIEYLKINKVIQSNAPEDTFAHGTLKKLKNLLRNP
jgi:hypothetical protein